MILTYSTSMILLVKSSDTLMIPFIIKVSGDIKTSLSVV